jgi:hypothetical protein
MKIFYNRIPKVANTSVVLTLYNVRFNQIPATPRVAKESFSRPSTIDETQLVAFENYYKFTFVRNPFSRVLSAYLGKIALNLKINRKLSRYSDNHIPSFAEFVRYLEEDGLYDNAHWAPQASLLMIPIRQFDFIGRFESFERDMMHVLTCMGLRDPRQVMVRHSNHPTDASNKLDNYYDSHIRSVIYKIYRDDFDAFHYAL